jgi:hypothetical protein
LVNDTSPAYQCNFRAADGQEFTYDYRSNEKKLYLVTVSDGQSHLLCDNVTAMTFTKNTVVDGAWIIVKSVQISMTVQVDNVKKTFSAATVIRRNLK